jgi:ribosome maturation factor RimP
VIEEKIKILLAEKFVEPEFSDCFLVDMTLNKTTLELFLDSDSGMTFEKCQRISRALEATIDAEKWLGEEYTLEVSSPGISRPLKFPRQYKKNIGRTLELMLVNEDSIKTGILKDVTDEHIIVEFTTKVKEGKKNRTDIQQLTVPYDTIKKAIIKISFK